MSASLTTPVPQISPGEMQLLLSRAGLVLNPGQVADLVLAWRQLAGLVASIPRDRPLADDMAIAFRLTPPPAGQRSSPSATIAAEPSRPRTRPVAKKAPARAKAKAKAKAPAKKAKGKAAPKRRVVRPAPRKTARRRR
jgi:hypothetical protein